MGIGFKSVLMSGLDPAGALLGSIAKEAPNSFVAKALGSGPLAGTGFQKTLSPEAYQAGQDYDNQNKPPPGYVAPANFGGINPTLATAAGGYQSGPAKAVAGGNVNTGPSTNYEAGPVGGPSTAAVSTNAVAPVRQDASAGMGMWNGTPAPSAGASQYVQAAGRNAAAQGQNQGQWGY